jgi:integrase/recombinase XerC
LNKHAIHQGCGVSLSPRSSEGCSAAKPRPVITKKNLDEFLAEVDAKGHLDFSFLVRAMIYMGMRADEAIKMKWSGYRPESTTYITDLTKNNEASAMPIPPPMMEWFEKVREERLQQGVIGPWICPSPRDPSLPRAKTSVSDMLDQIALKMGLGRLTRHRLRASFCTILHQSNVPIKKIQKLMRHSRVETTMSYIEVDGSELQEAVDNVFSG